MSTRFEWREASTTQSLSLIERCVITETWNFIELITMTDPSKSSSKTCHKHNRVPSSGPEAPPPHHRSPQFYRSEIPVVIEARKFGDSQ
ncbi:hypothetical protein QCA50_019974 [Cerrena zonata]|uniref:Uncharacterized protein n=1 Tax=Cerrena zonata TaxID=2478898 RepID=A0AAW0FAA8_9APHY